MKASLIFIGDEVSSGQIVNSNSTKLSQLLTDIGFEVVLHLVCPDRPELMMKCFNWAAENSEVIFCTGGLGPTSDDLTRETLSQWCELPLEFSNEAWLHLSELLKSRGREPKDVHRRQAYFPKGSTLLKNSLGTANGFTFSVSLTSVPMIASDLKIFVLPGPPKEIDSILQNQLMEILQKLVPEKKLLLATWLCTGKGESEFAEMTERVLKDSGLRIGYRLTYPNTEVKVWIPKEHLQTKMHHLDQLTESLKPYLVQHNPPS